MHLEWDVKYFCQVWHSCCNMMYTLKCRTGNPIFLLSHKYGSPVYLLALCGVRFAMDAILKCFLFFLWRLHVQIYLYICRCSHMVMWSIIDHISIPTEGRWHGRNPPRAEAVSILPFAAPAFTLLQFLIFLRF